MVDVNKDGSGDTKFRCRPNVKRGGSLMLGMLDRKPHLPQATFKGNIIDFHSIHAPLDIPFITGYLELNFAISY
jgi:hypothetical protein